MSKEEINYWLEVFSKDRFAFMSGDGKKISFYETFKDMKKLKQENTQLKSVLKEIREYIDELYDNTDDTTCYDIDKHRKEFLLEIIDKGIGKNK